MNKKESNHQSNNYIIQIEEALLGLIISHKKIEGTLSQVFLFLDVNNFNNERNRTLFKILKHFYEKQEKQIDIKLLHKYVVDNKLNKIITISYIDHLMNNAGFLSSINNYMTQLREYTSKQRLSSSLRTSLNDIIVNNNKSSAELIEEIRNHLYQIEERKITHDFQEGKDVVERVIEEIFKTNKQITGIKTGFDSLDEITNGLQKGDLIILAARPSVGKTAFALNLATNVMTIHKKSVAFFSLEMPAEQLIQRMLASLSFVDSYKLKHTSKLTEIDKEKLLEAQDKIKNTNFFIDDSGSIKLDEIIWKSRKQKEMGKLDLIVIDYLQLIPTNSIGDNRQQEVSKISRSLKQLARELGVPIIALSQLNRRVETREDKKPMMSDLRESGAIEQDADIIAFLYREDYYDKDKNFENKIQLTELNIAKHRNGAIGNIELSFNQAIGRFSDYTKQMED